MTYDPANPFARILRGELDADKLFEDEHAVAFLDVNPLAPAHVVVIPKGAYGSFDDFSSKASPEEQIGFLRAVGTVARQLGLDRTGYRIVSNHGAHADQDVDHFHVHLLGGRPLGPVLTEQPRPQEAADSPPADPLERQVLFLLPLAVQPSPDQVQAFARIMQLEAYEAGTRLRTPIPRVLRIGSAGEIRHLARDLGAADLPLGCVGTTDLLSDLDPWVVEWIELEGGDLILVGASGRVPLHIDRDALLVRGRYNWLPRMGTGTWALPGSAAAGASTTQFAHLYLAGQPRPYSFVEAEIRDYLFLGEDMAPSASTNFEVLMTTLALSPRVQVSDLLLKNHMQVKGAVDALWAGAGHPVTRSPDPNAEVLSRLIYYSTF